ACSAQCAMLLLPIQIPPSVLRRSASQELSTFQRQDAKTPRRKEQHVFLASLRLCVFALKKS
ncbi:MAG TPA: hypothetical protein PLK78_12840, partial [Verrucomicrobiota bacterium]|nr:hypothetical protein [Verrucomicrobiota bacterium]